MTELEEKLLKQIEALTNELKLLREQNQFLLNKLYGRSSEKSIDPNGQLDLFEEDSSFNRKREVIEYMPNKEPLVIV